jgi:hypothetical protein
VQFVASDQLKETAPTAVQPALFDLHPDDLETEGPDPIVLARQLCLDRTSDINEQIRAIEQVPDLKARLMKRANSPFFRPKQPVRDLPRAVSLLGRQEVLNVLEMHQQ